MFSLTVWALPALALEVRVAGPGQTLTEGVVVPAVTGEADTLMAYFQVGDIFSEGSTLGDGVPATLILVVDIWRSRSGWWDSLVRSRTISYRFRRDIWSGAYTLEYPGMEPDKPLTLPDRESLLGVLEQVHEVVLGMPRHFEPEKEYYVSVKALVKPMNVEDLQKVDAWLSGEVSESGGGGLLGIPRGLARMVTDLSGLGDESAEGQSGTFRIRR